MEFGILGPVEARRDGSEVVLGGPKPRALLAILLLNAGQVVSRDRLIDGLWGERPPASAAHTLDDYVSRLRRALGADRIERRVPGYRLRVEQDELDCDRFERLLSAGREALVEGDPANGLTYFEAALALWRGPALADVLFEPFAHAEAARLDERRLLAIEERTEAELALGRDTQLIAELEQLTARHPFRERLLAQLMLALYRAGRQAEALAVLQSARHHLAEELGLEPSPVLRDLEQKILTHDSSLGRPRVKRPARPQRPRRHRAVFTVVAAAAAAAAAAAMVVATRLDEGGPRASAQRIAGSELIGLSLSSGAPVHDVSIGAAPVAMTSDERSLWLADPNAGTVSRVDLRTRSVVERIPLGGNPGVVAVGRGSLWVAGVPGAVVKRIDPDTEAVTQTVGLGGATTSALVFGGGELWVADGTDDSLIELDSITGGVRRTVALDLNPTALAYGAGTIWAADYDNHSIAEVDPGSGRTLATISVGNGPVALAVGAGSLWVASVLDSTVSRIDPAQGSVVATIPVGSGPVALAVANRSIWVANQYSGTISQIDPRSNAVVHTTKLGATPTALTAAHGALWVGVQPIVQHRGGTLVLLHQTPLSVDPAVERGVGPFQVEGLTDDGLVTFNHVAGPRGLELVPDLAVSLPTPTDGGTTYTFRLRPGIRYSDGRPVRASDFPRAMRRVFLIRALDRDLLNGIVGAAACERVGTSQCDLAAGVVADDAARTVTFHLIAPDTQFLVDLANGGLSMPVPAGTPMHDTGFTPIPGTGPYKAVAADRNHIRYVRNPRFHEWSHAAQPAGSPDQIVWRFGLTPNQEVRAIRQGRADWMADPVPAAQLPMLETRYASQFHSYPITDTEWLQFNTNRRPFDDIRVRQALNLAVDRRVYVRIYGGSEVADPACQLLPPGVPGFHRYCPYTARPNSSGSWTAPDFALAQRLVAASGTAGMRITVWGWSDDSFSPPRVVEYTASVLRRLGYEVRVRLTTHAILAHPPAQVFAAIPVIPTGWADITAYNFFAPWLSCRGVGDHGWFCVERIDREMLRASSLDSTNPRAATLLWAKIDREIVNRAALVPLINPRQTVFVSRRVANFQEHSYLGLIADQVRLN